MPPRVVYANNCTVKAQWTHLCRLQLQQWVCGSIVERAIDNMAEKQPEPLVEKKGRTTSVIWRHFGFKSDVEQKEIVCKVCHTVVSAPQGNTTNLFNHKVVYDKVLKEQKTQKSARASTSATATATATQSSIEDTLYNAAPYPTGSRQQREITEAVIFML